MKALTLYQPWAQLVALGIKTIETRSWKTSFRGPLAIHASKRESALHYLGWLEEHNGEPEPALMPFADRITMTHSRRGRVVLKAHHDLPLGAVVATCTLVDVVPIIGPEENPFYRYPCVQTFVGRYDWCADGWLELYHPTLGNSIDPEGLGRSVPLEASYGDFTPGRYAWLFTDITPLPTPVAAKGRQGLWDCPDLDTEAVTP